MQTNTIQIANIKRAIGQLTIRIGMKMVRDAISDFTTTKGDFNRFKQSLFGLPVSQLDSVYDFTSFDNWQKIIATINPILQDFNWKPEVADCDKRAFFVVGMVAELFEINTVRPVYCSVYRVSDGQFAFDHYANILVDDVGNAYLWDLDNGEVIMGRKITSSTPIFGNQKYILKAVK